MRDREEITNNILGAVENYNAICSKHLLNHRIKYNPLNETLVVANRQQLSYGSYQCELAKGVENVEYFVLALIKMLCFEYGE